MAAGSVCKKHDAMYYNNNDLGSQDDRYPAVDKMNHLRSRIGDEQYGAWMRGKFPRFMETPMSEIEKALDAKIAECEREIDDAAWLAFAAENGIDAECISATEWGAMVDQAHEENQRVDALLDELNECNIFARALEIEEALADLGVVVAQEMRDKMIGEYMDNSSDARREMKSGVKL